MYIRTMYICVYVSSFKATRAANHEKTSRILSLLIEITLPGGGARNLPSGVIDLSEEIGIIILGSITVLTQPKTKDEVVSSEKNSEKTEVVDTEPFVGALRGDGGRGGEDGRDNSGGDGGDRLHHLGLVGGREGGLHNIGY